jgi:hypothetical protein
VRLLIIPSLSSNFSDYEENCRMFKQVFKCIKYSQHSLMTWYFFYISRKCHCIQPLVILIFSCSTSGTRQHVNVVKMLKLILKGTQYKFLIITILISNMKRVIKKEMRYIFMWGCTIYKMSSKCYIICHYSYTSLIF